VYNNDLSRFDESVFGPILQQMAIGKGFVNCIKGSKDIILLSVKFSKILITF